VPGSGAGELSTAVGGRVPRCEPFSYRRPRRAADRGRSAGCSDGPGGWGARRRTVPKPAGWEAMPCARVGHGIPSIAHPVSDSILFVSQAPAAEENVPGARPKCPSRAGGARQDLPGRRPEGQPPHPTPRLRTRCGRCARRPWVSADSQYSRAPAPEVPDGSGTTGSSPSSSIGAARFCRRGSQLRPPGWGRRLCPTPAFA
jgi:hypothetical protein